MNEGSFAKIQENAYLGSARICLDNLYFAPHASRIDNEKCEARLLNLFRDYSCDRDAYENRIPVAVSQELLRQALEKANMPISSIREAVPPFLPLPSTIELLALRGRHRWKAAKRFYNEPTDRWWTVVFFDANGAPCQVRTYRKY